MLTCFDVASYFLAQSNEESGDLLSNMKLQKLVYYAQGLYLAAYDSPLFLEEIQAWTHGPVVLDLYYRFKDFGAGAIPVPDCLDFEIFDEPAREMLDDVYRVYGQFSAWKLRELTHGEPPWVEGNDNGPYTVISHDALRRYFKTQLLD